MFDKQAVSSIGSLAVAPSDPNIVYVGTGEACIRGNISHGDGVYKTVDGGKTWKNTGLHDSRAIGKVIVDPKNSDIVFVAALGHPFGPNTERGIFRTTDGGKTWQRILYKDENTGGIDIAFDPNNSHILFASFGRRVVVPGSSQAAAREADCIAQTMTAIRGSGSKSTDFLKVPTDALEWPSLPTRIAFTL